MTQLGTKKSRRGCKRCKERRVKCDEQAPCNNCTRRKEECSLLDVEPSPSGSAGSSFKQDSASDPALPSNADEWIEDLALMHHYTANTHLMEPRGEQSQVRELWRNYIPQQAIQHRFLMHGLLALSALHLTTLYPDQATKYARICDKHQAIALAKYRSILASEIDMQSADALFAFASIISLSTMARSCSPIMMGEERAISIDTVVELFFLTRGVRDVIQVCYSHIRTGTMWRMIEGHRLGPDNEVALPDVIIERFQDLERMLDNAGLDPECLSHCKDALEHLAQVYRNVVWFVKNSVLETGHVWRWAVGVDNGFLRLVQGRIAPALIIVAHFAVATTAIRTAWYTRDWGAHAIRGIENELDPVYRHWLDWPKEHSARRFDILGVKVEEGDDDIEHNMIGF